MNNLAYSFDRSGGDNNAALPMSWRKRPAATGCPLTPRQLECLKWVGEGKSSVDIGSILAIAPSTVNEHLADACRRLGVRTRVQAIVECFREGWLK